MVVRTIIRGIRTAIKASVKKPEPKVTPHVATKPVVTPKPAPAVSRRGVLPVLSPKPQTSTMQKRTLPPIQAKPITQPVVQEKKTIGGAITGMLTGKTMEKAAEAQGGKLMMGTAPIGPAAGIGNLAKNTGKIVASKGLSSANVASAASGKLMSSVIRTSTNLQTGRVSQMAINTVNAAKATSYLTKLVQTATKPAAVLGLIGGTAFTSLFWAPNEKGDALTTLQITQNAAAKNGDIEMVAEIDALIEETLGIAANIPLVGFIDATTAKFKAAAVASKTNMREAERMKIKRAEKEAEIEAGKLDPKSPTADWGAITKDREVKRETERADDEAYFKSVEENRKKAKEEERADDEKYWAKISEEQKKKSEEKRKADNEYWAAIRKQKEESAPSKLKFGLLK